MATIHETSNFILEAADRPHVTREDGGHLRIIPKERVEDRTKLEPKKAVELMRLTMAAGEAMKTAMNRRGIDIGRINYQENGNWGVSKPEGPYLHVHVYGRAKSARIQKYGDALYLPHRDTGFYKDFEPFNKEDIAEIKKGLEKLLSQKKYQESEWGL